MVASRGMFANVPRGVLHSFKNESDQPAKMLILLVPAGLEKMFLEVGRELAPGTTTAAPPTQDELGKMLLAAPRYGVEMRLSGDHH